uniref:DUF7595 domain-containing protein n=1 Tax=Setaria viridis TaxID=4556 RepID=A0A4U6V779_SETVI|nr:LOW QUALITY PROTEIN: hypothetical protein SEVIR_3G093900v2 [Setaria viridis]
MRKGSRRGSSSPPFPLPLDLVLEIAALSDPATLPYLHRRIADPAFHGRLRLRHADRFVPSSCAATWSIRMDQYLVDYDTGQLAAAGCFPSGEPSRLHEPVAARDGLVLVPNVAAEELRVCSPVTGRSQTIHRGATFHGQYVLLVGDGDGGVIGRSFQVLKVTSVMSKRSRCHCLQIQTFSSVHGAWSPRIRVRLLANGAVHWLCRSDTTYYIFKLDVGEASAKVTATKLSASFHGAYGRAAAGQKHILLATKPACMNLCVLVTDSDRISVWSQSGCSPARWGERPEAVIKIDAVMNFTSWLGRRWQTCKVRLEWFAERSGVVLIVAPGSRYFWLDLRTKEIFRWLQLFLGLPL